MRNPVRDWGRRRRKSQREEGALRGVGIEEWLEVGWSCADIRCRLTGIVSAESIKILANLAVDQGQ